MAHFGERLAQINGNKSLIVKDEVNNQTPERGNAPSVSGEDVLTSSDQGAAQAEESNS